MGQPCHWMKGTGSWGSLCPSRDAPLCCRHSPCPVEDDAECTSLFPAAPLCLVSSLAAS